jgi:hypothetical protein
MTRKTAHRTRYTLALGALVSSLSTITLFGYSALAADLPAFSASSDCQTAAQSLFLKHLNSLSTS